MSALRKSVVAAASLAGPLFAQGPCAGNGIGSAYLTHSPAMVGGNLTIDLGSPAAPMGVAALAASDAASTTVFPSPIIGTVCLDVLSSGFYADLVFLDATGNATVTAPVPATPSLVNLPPLFITCVAIEGAPGAAVASISKTARVTWEQPNTYRSVGRMQVARNLHRATSLARFPGDNRTSVLLTGGVGGNFMNPVATRTSEFYVPLQRAFVAGPDMAVERGGHTSTLLSDGRVLIAGGVATGGAVTDTVEIFDPVTGTFGSAAPMSTPRTGHRATRLRDGRVLVTGGFRDWRNAQTAFAAALSTAQRSAEIYDPVRGTWSPTVNTMSNRRAVHEQVELADGRILVISGVRTGTVFNPGFGNPTTEFPVYTPTCDVFDPTTDRFTPTASVLLARGFFGSSRLPDGRVLISGGNYADQFQNNGASVLTTFCEVFDGTSWALSQTLGTAVGYHTQTPMADGYPFLCGGISNLLTFGTTATAGWFDGSDWGRSETIGLHRTLGGTAAPRGLHTATLLYDGTILVAGGSELTSALDDAFVFVPR